jgi:hypothetical protein
MPQFPTLGARPVWIASYPRSGNTFLRILLETCFQLPSYSLYYVEGDRHRDPSAEALDSAPLLPRGWREAIISDPAAPPVLIKTHDLPPDDSTAIYLARDGRAAIDSYYHYHKQFAFEQPSLTEVIAGACQFGSWSDHYWAWRPRSRPKTLLLTYDDLVSTPGRVVEKLSGFLNMVPATVALPGFNELHQRSPAFFRRGQNADYLQKWSSAQLALFQQLHGAAMEDLGFEAASAPGLDTAAVPELASSAARLHRMYLEQLSKLGELAEQRAEEVQRLSEQVRELSRQIEDELKPQLTTRWVRVGKAIGAMKRSPTEKNATSAVPSAESPKADSRQPLGILKASAGNTQWSEPVLRPGPLSASNGDVSARG